MRRDSSVTELGEEGLVQEPQPSQDRSFGQQTTHPFVNHLNGVRRNQKKTSISHQDHTHCDPVPQGSTVIGTYQVPVS